MRKYLNFFKHHKYCIAVLKEGRRQLLEEANKLSLLTEPKIYADGKTTYRVWTHTIQNCWDGYGKDVRVIVSEETTIKRVHARDGKSWEQKSVVSNWMWVTNFMDSSLGDLKNTVRICHSRWQIENKCFRRNSKYLESRPYLQAQRKCNNCISSAFIYLCKYL